MSELLDETSRPDHVPAAERTQLIAESAEVELSIAATADLIAYSGKPELEVETIAMIAGMPLRRVPGVPSFN